jgi:aspartate/methionine/tyrosine aminotransferase
MRQFLLEKYFAKWEFTAQFHLAASDAESFSVGDLLKLGGPGTAENFAALRLGYTETRGDPSLREEISMQYDGLTAASILCFAGAEEAIYASMRALLGPGDHVLVLTPNYQSIETVPLAICQVEGVPLRPEQGWELDIDEVSRMIRPNTKLVAINFPHNPTGKIIKRQTLEALVGLCRRSGVWLFSDEVYAGIEIDADKSLPPVASLYERGLSLNVMSKAYGLPSLRIGWLATQDLDALQRISQYKHYLSICNSGPSEFLALLALRNRAVLLDRNRAICTRNLALLNNFFQSFNDRFEWYEPDGGCVMYPRYLGAEGVGRWTERMVNDHGIFLLPAGVYRSELTSTPQDRFRIGYGRSAFNEGLQALAKAMQN